MRTRNRHTKARPYRESVHTSTTPEDASSVTEDASAQSWDEPIKDGSTKTEWKSYVVEIVAAAWAFQLVRHALNRFRPENPDVYQPLLNFVVAGLVRRGVMFDDTGKPLPVALSTEVNLEAVRRRALRIAVEELRAAADAHRHVAHREADYRNWAAEDIEISAWEAGAIERYRGGHKVYPVTFAIAQGDDEGTMSVPHDSNSIVRPLPEFLEDYILYRAFPQDGPGAVVDQADEMSLSA